MDNQRFKTLAEKYLDGTAAPEEKQELMQYYKLLQKRHLSWEPDAMGDQEALERELLSNINREIGRSGRRRSFSRVLKVAASVVILLSAGLVIWQYRYGIRNYIDPVQELTAATAPRELKELRLADGSRIWLNAGSELRYPGKFRDSLRVVRLTGEAYFEVAPDAKKPFVIHTGGITTRVLGTTFNVTAYAGEEKATVTVLSGKVAVRDTASGRKALLTPEQQLTYNRAENTFTKAKVADPGNAVAWRNGKLAFNGAPVTEVVAALQRWYHVSISFDDQLASCPVFADLTGEPVGQALEILAVSLQGKATPEDSGYHISGKQCE